PGKDRIVNISRSNASALSTFFPFGAESNVSVADKKYEAIQFTSENWNVPQPIVISADKNLDVAVNVKFIGRSGNLPLTWALCFGGIGALLVVLGLYHLVALPKPEEVSAAASARAPFPVAASVMAGVVLVPVALFMAFYYGLTAVMDLAGIQVVSP